MKSNISEDQLSMKNMEIDLSELNMTLMPELSDSAAIIVDQRNQLGKDLLVTEDHCIVLKQIYIYDLFIYVG